MIPIHTTVFIKFRSKLSLLTVFFYLQTFYLIYPFFSVVTCGKNQIYQTRKECTKTCLYPTGSYDCGLIYSIEGCFCLDGYVLDNNGNCVLPEDCGCNLPDNSALISVSYIDFCWKYLK